MKLRRIPQLPFFFDLSSRAAASWLVVLLALAHLALSLTPEKSTNQLQGWWDDISIDSLSVYLPDNYTPKKWESNGRKTYPAKRKTPFKPAYSNAPIPVNALDSSGWLDLGLSPRQAQVVLGIRERKGGFNSVEELIALPYLPQHAKQQLGKHGEITNLFTDSLIIKPADANTVLLDINRADSLELMGLKGLGKRRCAELLALRRQLGGFHTPAFLWNLYNMDSARYDLLSKQLLVTEIRLNTWNLNRDSRERLLEFPLLTPKVVHRTVNHRLRYGYFKQLKDWIDLPFVGDSLGAVCSPYLSWE